MVITAVANFSPQGAEGLGKAGAACDSLDAAVENMAAMGSSLLQSYCEIFLETMVQSRSVDLTCSNALNLAFQLDNVGAELLAKITVLDFLYSYCMGYSNRPQHEMGNYKGPYITVGSFLYRFRESQYTCRGLWSPFQKRGQGERGCKVIIDLFLGLGLGFSKFTPFLVMIGCTKLGAIFFARCLRAVSG